MNRNNVIAVLSMLHEPASRAASAQRIFHGQPVLTWTLGRLSRCANLSQIAILCWQEQKAEQSIALSHPGVKCFAPSQRTPLASLDAITTSRRWADGWRGGLLGACEFDRGFHAQWTLDLLNQFGGDSACLVDPCAGLVDPDLIDALIDHAAGNEEIDFFFTPAAPGLSGVMIRKSMLEKLAKTSSHPGLLITYRPDIPQRDPISTLACAQIPSKLARTLHRFTLDSDRQISRLDQATEHLNGNLITTSAQRLLDLVATTPPQTSPREVVLELTPRRSTRPIYLPPPIDRPDMELAPAIHLLNELATIDDLRLILAGAGDPLLSPIVFDVLTRAADLGIAAAIETDLLGINPSDIARLAESRADVISIHLPAATAATYQTIMQTDGFKTCLDNIGLLASQRQARSASTPLLVPTFTKLAANLAEMEPWYDHWLRLFGSAVIVGPSDFSGSIPDVSAARMEPPQRKPCARLSNRLTILSDGKIVSCEQDVHGKQILGQIGRDSLVTVWNEQMAALRGDHQSGNWLRHEVCAGCSDWHRP
jgi:radical SAM protein with 4Fe4S-binding SPASM domain